MISFSPVLRRKCPSRKNSTGDIQIDRSGYGFFIFVKTNENQLFRYLFQDFKKRQSKYILEFNSIISVQLIILDEYFISEKHSHILICVLVSVDIIFYMLHCHLGGKANSIRSSDARGPRFEPGSDPHKMKTFKNGFGYPKL